MKHMLIMIALLMSTQSVIADDRIVTRHLETWGITKGGDLYLKTKKGDEFIAPLNQCSTNNIDKFETPQIYMHGRWVRNGKTVHLYDKNAKQINSIKCKLGEIARIAWVIYLMHNGYAKITD